ncbi:hypothetical protein CBR_g3645 [Chara braunii]|uniref:OBG-type G domain-containing protein n=1 Tax=Chara braunii TaxID=69332 RepID=A0A388KFZ4_CHABU|nr:hypothetical protein CBR_g3645 [Chara braunii]|eukprot:GBG68946.1 hypothetical protein CBR_g3645 [Chara braunii]
MATVMQKIKDIEDEMARTQKNKATSHHIGLLKAKLAKLRRDILAPPSKGGGGSEPGFDVTKSGDARVGLVGFPSVGKSTLLNKLTGTFSEVASYEFTTLTCIPGVIQYKGARIQVIGVARTCSAILIVLDAIKPITHKKLIEKELEGFGISAHMEWNLDGLLEKVWEYLNLVRVYTKPKGLSPDYEDPVILSADTRSVEDFCLRIHKDLLKHFKYALVWGSSAKHKPQRVGKVS